MLFPQFRLGKDRAHRNSEERCVPNWADGVWRRMAVVVLASMSVMVVASAHSQSALATTSASSSLGVYFGPGDPGGVDQLGASIGQRPAYAMDFLDGGSWQSISDPTWPLAQWSGRGYQMIWGVPILPDSGASLAAGASGSYDQYFSALAQNLVSAGQGQSIIRLGWEFNGNWFQWGTNGGSASQFVSYWHHIIDAMRSVPGSQFRFEWNPTRGGSVDLASYYPGDSYVDVIGLDVYDVEWANYPGAQSEFAAIESQTYGLNWLDSFSSQHNKPMALPEWGLGWGPSSPGSGPVTGASSSVSGGDDPTFISDMAAWIRSHNVLEATFWDYGTSQVGGGQNPNTLSALAAAFGPGAASSSLSVLNASIVGVSATPDGGGYWLSGRDGGVFSYGDATFAGSTGGMKLNAPIVGFAAGTTGGYYEVASDGGIFAFGGAPFLGSMGGQHLNSPIVGIAAANGGYYEVASDGGIFAFGAPFLGSMGGQHLNAPIVGIAANPKSPGYWLIGSDGGVFAFGGAQFLGSPG